MPKKNTTSSKPFVCSFCQKEHSKVEKVFVGISNTFICNECIDNCQALLKEEQEKKKKFSFNSLLTPRQIKNKLDEYVIGQEKAKRILAVSAYNHYKKIILSTYKELTTPQKSNVLLLGPTGTGKTLLAETLAEILDVPLVIVDATSFTEAGYVGGDVEDCLYRLLEKAHFNRNIAENGIIYIDEIDKIASKGGRSGVIRDVGGEGVQQALLKLVEGSEIEVTANNKKKKSLQEEVYKINTSNILFICGGAFVDLEKAIEHRVRKQVLGFNAVKTIDRKKENIFFLDQVIVDDIINYGLIPELVGRLPVIVALEELDEIALMEILVKPKDALLSQYQQLFELENVKLVFSEKSLRSIAREALKQKNGARGLRRVTEKLLLDSMFEAPSEKNLEEIIFSETSMQNSFLGIYSNK